MSQHMSVNFGEPGEDGWIYAECMCGWQEGPFPEEELACDALMQHARERALLDDVDTVLARAGWRLAKGDGTVSLRSDDERPSAWGGRGHRIYVLRNEVVETIDPRPESVDSGSLIESDENGGTK